MSGNSLVSRRLVASYLGGVSWVEVPCSAPAPSWNSLFGISLFLQRNFLGGVSWVGYPGWQFFPFLCVGEKLPGGLTWLESAGIFLFLGGVLCGNSLVSRCLVASYLGGVSWVEVPCSAPAPSWNSLFDSFFGI